MFYRAALDINKKNGPLNTRFISCVKFVADVATPAAFYIHGEFTKQLVLQSLDFCIENLTSEQRNILKELDLLPDDKKSPDVPTLVYLVEGSWDKPADPQTGAMSGLITPNREFVLSTSETVHKAHLRDSGLNAQTAILCLAAVGLDIMLPNVSFSLIADEEIERIKEDLMEERHGYLELVANIADQSFERLKDGNYRDAIRWAESEAAFKLAPKARIIEEAVSSLATRQLRKAGYSFWKDGVPAIGSAYIAGGIIPAGLAATQVALKTLVDTVNQNRSERLLPEVAYAMKISKAL